jgi:hypothetical protein
MAWHVIVGGGFGGFRAARALERAMPDASARALISHVDFMLPTPLLPGRTVSRPRSARLAMMRGAKRELRLPADWNVGLVDPQAAAAAADNAREVEP